MKLALCLIVLASLPLTAQEVQHALESKDYVWNSIPKVDSANTGTTGSGSVVPRLPDSPAVFTSMLVATAQPKTSWSKTELALDFGVIASHALDWSSTEQCARRPYKQCHESELPEALVHSKIGLAAFEGAEAAVEIWGQHKLERKHRKLAYIAQSVNIGFLLKTDVHNYSLAK
jgi:hypothetical protein